MPARWRRLVQICYTCGSSVVIDLTVVLYNRLCPSMYTTMFTIHLLQNLASWSYNLTRRLGLQRPGPVIFVLLEYLRCSRLGETPQLPVLWLPSHNPCLHDHVLDHRVPDGLLGRRVRLRAGSVPPSSRRLGHPRKASCSPLRSRRRDRPDGQLLLRLKAHDALPERCIWDLVPERDGAVRDDAGGLELQKLPRHFLGSSGADLPARRGSEGTEANVFEDVGIGTGDWLVYIATAFVRDLRRQTYEVRPS